MTFSRVSGAAALGFVVTVVAATATLQSAGVPAVDASHDEIATFVTDNATQIGISSAIAPLAWLLLLVFGAGAFAQIWRIERARGEAWSLLGLSGLVMQNGVFAGVVAVQVALLAGAPASDGFWDLHNALFELNKTALALALIGFSIGGLRTATMHRWHGAVGLLSAALLMTAAMLTPVTLGGGPAALSLIGFAGFALWLLWLIAYGLTLLREHTTTAAHQEPASPGLRRDRQVNVAVPPCRRLHTLDPSERVTSVRGQASVAQDSRGSDIATPAHQPAK